MNKSLQTCDKLNEYDMFVHDEGYDLDEDDYECLKNGPTFSCKV